MVGGFFPAPYPDECYYSVLCRYFVRSGNAEYAPIARELFGNIQALSTSVFFPMRMDCFERLIPRDSGIARRGFATNHTMYPYMAVYFTQKFRTEMERVFAGSETKLNIEVAGRQKAWRLWSEYLRYCPECVREDIALYGETYWHRVHQLPGVVYCTKHEIRLIDSDVAVRDTTKAFYAASNQTLLESSSVDNLKRYKKKFLRIGKESEWLLNHGMEVDWNFDYQLKYKRSLREKGVATVQGISDYDLIIRSFDDYWGHEFLKSLYIITSDTREWIRQFQEANIKSFKPIYHILLMCFLKDSVEVFLEYEPSTNPFGRYPWACLNPICDHYQVDGCQNTDIRYQCGIAFGAFKCDYCDLIYRQTKRKGHILALYVVDYGEVWKGKLLNLHHAGTTESEIAVALNCTLTVVRTQKRKLDLRCEPYKDKRVFDSKLRDLRKSGLKISRETFYKEQVLELCEKYTEVTIAMLHEYIPGAYSYFSKHDFEWLRCHIVYERDTIAQQQLEQELVEKAKAAVKFIREKGDAKKRITSGYIASVAGVNETYFKIVDGISTPVREYVKTVIESKEEWLCRRITAIWQERNQVGLPITLADVKLEMSLKPNTYIKYGNFIKELINELNEKHE
jgi:hypothetical protein